MKRLGMVISLLLFALAPGLQLHAQPPGEILRAEYGAGSQWVDVTLQVRSLFRGREVHFRADNATLGGDPAPGAHKILRLTVREGDGEIRQLEFHESQNVNLRGYNSWNDFRGLRILDAEYGAGEQMADVTARLNAAIRDDRLSLAVVNQTMGGDPAERKVKTLTVWYMFDGRSEQVMINENGYLDLPGEARYANDGRDDRDDHHERDDADERDGRYNEGELQITRALYGAGKRVMDVTGRLIAQIRQGRLGVPVMNETMGGDPARGKVKTLTVWYTYRGQSEQAVVSENGYLNLPGDAGDARDEHDHREDRDSR
jgi:DnaJ-like protein C11, C-terminal